MSSKKRDIIPLALLLLPHFDPNVLTQDVMPDWIDLLLKILQCISIFFSLFFIPTLLKSNEVKWKYSVFIITLFVILLFSSYSSGSGVVKPFFYFFEIFSLITTCSFYIFIKKNVSSVITVLSDYFLILIILDILTLLFIPRSMENLWLFGGKNNHIYFIIPFLFFYLAKKGLQKDITINDVILPIALVFTVNFLEGSVTALFALILTCFFLLYYSAKSEKRIKKPVANIKYVYFGSLVISAFFIIFEQISLLELLIIYFDKEETFGRIGIWQSAIEFINQRPYLGYGFEDMEAMSEKFRLDISHCHNKFVDVIYMTGAVGFVFFILSMWTSFSSAKQSKYQLLISLPICAYAIEFLTEGKRINLIFYLMLFLYPILSNYVYKIKEGYEGKVWKI